MTEESNNNDNVEDQSEQPEKLILDFDFTPDWARKSSSEITFNEPKSGGRSLVQNCGVIFNTTE